MWDSPTKGCPKTLEQGFKLVLGLKSAVSCNTAPCHQEKHHHRCVCPIFVAQDDATFLMALVYSSTAWCSDVHLRERTRLGRLEIFAALYSVFTCEREASAMASTRSAKTFLFSHTRGNRQSNLSPPGEFLPISRWNPPNLWLRPPDTSLDPRDGDAFLKEPSHAQARAGIPRWSSLAGNHQLIPKPFHVLNHLQKPFAETEPMETWSSWLRRWNGPRWLMAKPCFRKSRRR